MREPTLSKEYHIAYAMVSLRYGREAKSTRLID
jgi:hypothetical protein